MSLQNIDDTGQIQNKCKIVSDSSPQKVHISSTSANKEIDLLVDWFGKLFTLDG